MTAVIGFWLVAVGRWGQIQNGSFEAGLAPDINCPAGWNCNADLVSVVTSAAYLPAEAGQTWLPVDGKHFAYLRTLRVDNEGSGAADGFIGQAIQMSAGQVLKLWIFADFGVGWPYNDQARVVLKDLNKPGPGKIIFETTVADVGDYGQTGWLEVSWLAPVGSNYWLQVEALNGGINPFGAWSAVGVDQVTVVNPEPASILLWLATWIIMYSLPRLLV